MRSPQEIVEYINKNALRKTKTSTGRVLILGFLAGAYISIGVVLSTVIGFGFPSLAADNPSLIKLLTSITFPVGIILIMTAGGELFTGCCAYFTPNLLSRRQKLSAVVKYCTIIWIANFLGALFFSYFMVHLTNISNQELTQQGFFTIAQAKTSNTFLTTMLKGVGANWLVCLAIWLAYAAKSMVARMIGLWLPIMTFVAIGYEHSIANMSIIPIAMMEGFDLSTTELFTHNLIPTTLGNIIGGALFVGGMYWYLFDSKNREKI